MIIFVLAFLGFVVGMIKPQTVGFKSRGKVALVYLGVSLASAIIGGSLMEDTPQTATNPSSDRAEIKQTEQTETPVETSPQEKEEESSIGKPVEVGHFVYTVQKVSFRKTIGDDFMEETADGIYMVVDLTIKNIGDETHTLDGSFFSVTDKEGVEYEYSITGSTALEMSGAKTLFLKECQPNITTKGVLVFEVPERGEYYLHLLGNFWGTRSTKILLK